MAGKGMAGASELYVCGGGGCFGLDVWGRVVNATDLFPGVVLDEDSLARCASMESRPSPEAKACVVVWLCWGGF